MARGSDIDFAKLVLIFGLAKKEEICLAIREVALLQETGINKRLAHIMYERKFLSAPEIQAILWVLYNVGRIRRFPARIVYEFSAQDDTLFLEKAKAPFSQVLEGVSQKKQRNLFPQEALIYCQDIQRKLVQQNFDRTLLSILSARGHLTEEYRNLIPHIQDKKKIIASPKQVQSPAFRRQWEALLFSAFGRRKYSLAPAQVEEALATWHELVDKHKLDIRYSEVLYYMGALKKEQLHEVGLAFRELTAINQTPRLEFLSSKARQYVAKNPQYRERYTEIFALASELQQKGLKLLDGGNLLLHQEILSPEEVKKARLADEASTRAVQELQEQRIWSKSEKKDLLKSFIPFSLRELERELEKLYLEERLATRHNPTLQADHIVSEWAQTELISFTPTEDHKMENRPGRSSIFSRKRQPATTPPPGDTEYIHLPDKDKKPFLENDNFVGTEYIAIDDANRLKKLSEKIEETMTESRSTAKLLMATFIMTVGVSIVVPNLKVLLGNPAQIPIYSGLSIFVMCIPGILFSNFFGNLADKGKVHLLYKWGLIIHSTGIVLLIFGDTIYSHLLIRMYQAVGLTALGIALQFCIGRWFGLAERGKMLGTFAVFAGVGTTFGYLLTSVFSGIGSLLPFLEKETADFVTASALWSVVCLAVIPILGRIHIPAVSSEDSEEENLEDHSLLPKEPLLAMALYGIVEMGLLVVFLPTFSQKLTTDVTEDMLVLWLGIGSLFGGYCFGRLSDRTGPVPILRGLIFLTIVSMFLIPYTIRETAIIQMVFLMIGLAVGAVHPLGLSWLLESMDDERYFGVGAAAFTIYLNLGGMFGCIFCGVLFYLFDLSVFFLILTIIMIGFFYFLLLTPASSRKPKGAVRGILRLLEPAAE